MLTADCLQQNKHAMTYAKRGAVYECGNILMVTNDSWPKVLKFITSSVRKYKKIT